MTFSKGEQTLAEKGEGGTISKSLSLENAFEMGVRKNWAGKGTAEGLQFVRMNGLNIRDSGKI